MHIVKNVLDGFFQRQTRAYVGPVRRVQARFKDLVALNTKRSRLGRAGCYEYTLDFRTSRQVLDKLCDDTYWETQFGFLFGVRDGHNFRTIAVVGFEIRSTYLFIRQVEELKDVEKYLHVLNYERLLYQVVISFAQELDRKEVRVCPGHQADYHPFAEPGAGEDYTPGEWERAVRLHTAYNVRTRECGFRWDPQTETHIFTLAG